MHLAVSPDSHDIVLEVLTDNTTGDCEVCPDFLDVAPSTLLNKFLPERLLRFCNLSKCGKREHYWVNKASLSIKIDRKR